MTRDINQSSAQRDPASEGRVLRERGDEDFPEPPRLRTLRRLVTALTVVLIMGIAIIAVTLTLQLAKGGSDHGVTEIIAPQGSTLRLPPGETAISTTLSEGFIGVLTEDAAGLKRLRAYGEDGAPLWAVTVEEQ